MSLCCRGSSRAQEPNSHTAASCSPSASSTMRRNSSIARSRVAFTLATRASPLTTSPRPAAARRPAGEIGPQVLAGVAPLARRDVFGGAARDDMAAGVAAFGAEIDDPVRGLDDFEIVLDDEDRVAGLDQRVQYLEELAHIVEMQPGRRLVEDVEGSPIWM